MSLQPNKSETITYPELSLTSPCTRCGCVLNCGAMLLLVNDLLEVNPDHAGVISGSPPDFLPDRLSLTHPEPSVDYSVTLHPLWDVLLPQRVYQPPSAVQAFTPCKLDFKYNDHMPFRVRDALDGRFAHLFGRDDLICVEGSTIHVRLEWIGYPSHHKQIKKRDDTKDRNPITRSKLAAKVAKMIQSFIESAKYNITPSEDELRWEVGNPDFGKISVNDLSLESIERVSHSSWKVALWVFKL